MTTTQRNKAVVRAFYERGDAGDIEGLLALLDDEVTWTNIGSTRFSGRYEGKQAVVGQLMGPLFAELDGGIASQPVSMTAEADRVVVETGGRARTRDGRPYNNTYCHVFTVRDGSIVAVREYMDTALVDRTFGPA